MPQAHLLTGAVDTDIYPTPPLGMRAVNQRLLFPLKKEGAVAHVTAPLLFVESKNKKHVFVKIEACATDFLENQKFSMDL